MTCFFVRSGALCSDFGERIGSSGEQDDICTALLLVSFTTHVELLKSTFAKRIAVACKA
jgi:hypothetical protein